LASNWIFIKGKPETLFNRRFMLKNYFLVAIRNLRRSKVFSLINIVGLALGMACSLLILLWIRDEQNMDKFNKSLLGLAMFTAEQRTREIGIRKVLGASLTSLFGLLSKDFIVLVCIALLIASPIAWYAMKKWLDDFAYKTPITWWMFVVAGLAAVIITLFTVSFQAVKAALVNPVHSLRSE
jgi:FtsX-like permease family